MSEEFDDLYTGLVASLDQMESLMRDTAPVFTAYYKALIKEGAPDDLAQVLVQDFHRIFWKNTWSKTRD